MLSPATISFREFLHTAKIAEAHWGLNYSYLAIGKDRHGRRRQRQLRSAGNRR